MERKAPPEKTLERNAFHKTARLSDLNARFESPSITVPLDCVRRISNVKQTGTFIRMISIAICLLLTLLPVSIAGPVSIRSAEVGPFAIHATSLCAPPSFIDPTSLTCRACPENSVYTGRSQWMPCECKSGFYALNPLYDAGSTNGGAASPTGSMKDSHLGASWALTCSACPANQVSWRDRSGCTTCDSSTGAVFDSTTNDCTCGGSRTLRLSEFDEFGSRRASGKACVNCPPGAVVELTSSNGFSADLYSCHLCPDIRMDRDPSTFACKCSQSTDDLLLNVPVSLAPTSLSIISGMGEPSSSGVSAGVTSWASLSPQATIGGSVSLAFPTSSPFESSAFVRRPIATSSPSHVLSALPSLAQAYHSLWPTTSVCVPSSVLTTFLNVFPISAASSYSLRIDNVRSDDSASSGSSTIRNAALETHLLPAAVRCDAAVKKFISGYHEGPAVATSPADPAAATGTGTIRFLPNTLDSAACETLANLCVLTHYDQSHIACSIYNKLLESVMALNKPRVNVRDDSAPPSGSFNARDSPGFTHHFQDWPLALPWLLYSDAEAAAEAVHVSLRIALASSNIGVESRPPTSLASVSSVGSSSSGVRFAIVTRSLNGTLVSIEELTNHLIKHCTVLGGSSTEAMNVVNGFSVGASQNIDCEIAIPDIVSGLNLPKVPSTGSVVAGGGATSDSSTPATDIKSTSASRFLFRDTYFYELFMLDSNSKWYPIPVKVTTFRTGSGSSPNGFTDTIDSSTRLVRRFMLVDNLGGLPSTPLSPLSSPTPLLFSRWPSKVMLSMRVRGSSIYPPLLVIDYAARAMSDVFRVIPSALASVRKPISPFMTMSSESSSDSSSTKLFQTSSIGTSSTPGYPYITLKSGAVTKSRMYTTFSNGHSDAKLAAIILFSFGVVLAFVLFIFRYSAWSQAERPDACQILMILRALGFIARYLGEICFWLCFAFASYFTVFYKGQESVAVMIPLSGSWFQVQLETFIYVSFSCQLFGLIGTLCDQLTTDTIFIDWETVAPTIGAQRNGAKAVSAWRRIFVANKWAEMQTVRGINLPLNLVSTGLLMVGASLEGISTSQPDASNLSVSSAPRNPIMQIFMSSVIFLGLTGVQRLFKFLITDRFSPRPAVQFVDLLTATNISMCIIDRRHHMFYIHGKSVHSHVDAPLEELHRQMQRERRSWVQTRGLVGGQSCFSVFLTPQFRYHYDAEYYAILHEHIRNWGRAVQGLSAATSQDKSVEMQQMGNNHNGITTEADVTGLLSDELVRAHNNLNRFLIDFFERNLVFHRWELYARSFVEELFDFPPSLVRSTENTSSVCVDTRNKFTSTILLGIEHQLIMFYVTVICATNLWFNKNTPVSLISVFFFDRLITWIRGRWGKINIATKSMIDQRYLV